jgi:integrin-linked kinase-associated serine/threonine phosphatase 2C
MAHQKREGSSTDDDCASKRLKGTDAASETGGSVEGSVSQETAAEVTRTCQKESEAPLEKCTSDGKAVVNSKVSGEQNMVLTAVEADAAEDKGCRHTMEDAWVLLPNAGAESPGSLRCAHFAIYDGHGGRLAADFAEKHLHQNVIAAGLPHGC